MSSGWNHRPFGKPYSERRRLREGLELDAPGWVTIESLIEPVTDVMDACASLGLEGIVAKRTDSRYRPGIRSDDWLKLKTAAWYTTHAPKRIDERIGTADRYRMGSAREG